VVHVYGEQEITETGLIDAPVKVEVISKEYIERQQYQDLSQAISDMPGVSTTRDERRAGSSQAQIQGFGENSVLVMIDGTPVSQNSSFGLDLTQISTSDIEKVEVIKGGASALYGSQAMGGVINIVTKRPKKETRVDLDLSASRPTDSQQGEGQSFQLNTSGEFHKVRTKLSLSYRDTEELDLDPSTLSMDAPSSQRRYGSLFLERSFAQTEIFTNYILLQGQTLSKNSKPYTSSTFGASVNETDSTTHNFKLGLKKKLDRGELKAVANLERIADELVLNDRPQTPFPETFKETSFEARRLDILYDKLNLGGHQLSFGVLFKETVVDQQTTTQAVEQIVVKTKDLDQRKIRSYEAFVQDNIFIDSFEVSPGVRYQYDQDFGAYASPKINISHYYDHQDFSFKTWLSVGTGFRTPTVKERFFTLDHTSVANYIVIGNDELEPESSLSFQLGEEVRVGRETSLYTNLFLNRVQDMIETVERPTTDTGRVFSNENLERVTSRGLEVGLKSVLTSKLNLRTNYTYTEIYNEITDSLLPNRPLHTALLGLDFKVLPRWTFSSLSRYVGDKYSDMENSKTIGDYTTLDLKLNFSMNKNIQFLCQLK
jgi:outer membrane receptor for ferrienterochelin and colicins